MGYVDSWVVDDREDSVFDGDKRILRYVPQMVLVQFMERVWKDGDWVEEPCKWTVDGINRH